MEARLGYILGLPGLGGRAVVHESDVMPRDAVLEKKQPPELCQEYDMAKQSQILPHCFDCRVIIKGRLLFHAQLG